MAGYMSDEESVYRSSWHRAIDLALRRRYDKDIEKIPEFYNLTSKTIEAAKRTYYPEESPPFCPLDSLDREKVLSTLEGDKNVEKGFTKEEARNYFRNLGFTQSEVFPSLMRSLSKPRADADTQSTSLEERQVASCVVARKISARVGAGNCNEFGDTAAGIIIDNIEEAKTVLKDDAYLMRGGMNDIDHEYLLTGNTTVWRYPQPDNDLLLERGEVNTIKEVKVEAPPGTIVIDPWRLVGQVLYWKHSAWYEKSGGAAFTKRWEYKLTEIEEIANHFKDDPEIFGYPKKWSEFLKENDFCNEARLKNIRWTKKEADKQYTGENKTKAMNYWSEARGKEKCRSDWENEWERINKVLGKGIAGRKKGRKGSWFKLNFEDTGDVIDDNHEEARLSAQVHNDAEEIEIEEQRSDHAPSVNQEQPPENTVPPQHQERERGRSYCSSCGNIVDVPVGDFCPNCQKAKRHVTTRRFE